MARRVDGIRAVTYDCWGTLLEDRDFEGAVEIRIGALRRSVGLDEGAARSLVAEAWERHDDAWKQIETFGPGRMAAYCLARCGIDDDRALAELTRAFEEASIDSGVRAVPGAREVLAELSGMGVGLGLVCDTGFTPGRVVRRFLDENGLLDHLDVLCFSDEVGVPKPGNDIFAKALAGLGVRPPETIHVGDLRRTDIAGARDVGMHAARFRGVHDDRSEVADADIVLDRHDQIFEVLGAGPGQ